MREIKFRGMTIGGEWVYGLLAHKDDKWYISNSVGMPFAYEVRPETIGQFTGLYDSKNQPIYEGDLVKAFHPTELAEIKAIGEVTWTPESKNYMYAGWYIKPKNKHVVLMAGDIEYEIIGNIYSDPSLLQANK